MKLMMTRVLDIRKANKRANLFSNISGLCGCIAFAIMVITALTIDSEPGYSNMYYAVILLSSVVLTGIAFIADRVATHIRALIADAIHEKNEKEWSRR